MKKCLFIGCLVILGISIKAEEEIKKIDKDTVKLIPIGGEVLSGVPQYEWYYGCSPTAGGMIIAYWDSHPSGKWANLVDGDVSSFNDIAKNMIASSEHIHDYWGDPDPHPGEHPDNCIADFMHTSRSEEGLRDGKTSRKMVPIGLKAYANWDNPSTAVNEAYNAESWREEVEYLEGPFNWEAFKKEIDKGNPLILNLVTYAPDIGEIMGHSVAAYGYKENMFNLKIYSNEGWKEVTVGGFAVWDTWDTSSSQSSWLGQDGSTVYSYLDSDGVEWWPFLDISITDGWVLTDYWDWQVIEGVYFHPGDPIPEPSSLIFLISGLVGLGVATKMKFFLNFIKN